jgi:hypothetical protein
MSRPRVALDAVHASSFVLRTSLEGALQHRDHDDDSGPTPCVPAAPTRVCLREKKQKQREKQHAAWRWALLAMADPLFVSLHRTLPPVDLAPLPSLPLGTFCSYAPNYRFPVLGSGGCGAHFGPGNRGERMGTYHILWSQPWQRLCSLPQWERVLLRPTSVTEGNISSPRSHSFVPHIEIRPCGPHSFRGTTGNSIFSLISTIEETLFSLDSF